MAAMALAGCGPRQCPLPKQWRLVSSLQPSPVPYSPSPVYAAQEMQDGRWLWLEKSVAYDVLLREVAVMRSLRPTPVIIFNFADGHSCNELTSMRHEIAKAAKCGENSFPCLQGTMAEFEARS
jgi:hypothetical protein